ncbi:MAG TPA: hypothetical protein VNT76_16470, partial [Candidatus Binatus sp.]|nr:hypothetical protein [Candidatus Binatus sp.]
GFAGNQCQIILELAGKISADVLQIRLASLQKELPMLNARIGGMFKPKWKIPSQAKKEIPVRVHQDDPGLRQKLFNEPLRVNRGELMRFDLIHRDGERMDLIFTWVHTLMDAIAAEHFLTAVSDEKIVLPKTNPQPPGAPAKWPERLELMKKSVAQLDKFCENQPRSLKTRHADAPRELAYRVEKFSAGETKTIRANGARLCGVLGDAQFHNITAALELHRLHQKLGVTTKSYIVPMPVGLRPKGRIEPLFSNQVDMLMLQFLPEHLESAEKAVAALKSQATQALRENSIGYGRKLSELFSFLPLPVYMAVLKHGLKGEICSLFFGDTAAVNPKLENFLGVTVENFTHVAAVTPAPGLGVIFYYFRGELRVSIVHAKTILSDAEAAEFSAAIRHRLLNP